MGNEREERALSSDGDHEEQSQAERALQPVSLPAPKTRRGQPAVAVRTDRAPTVHEILDPERPSLEDAEHAVVVDAVKEIVEELYKALEMRLDTLRTALAEVSPPARSDTAVRLIAWIAEMIATGALGLVGSIAAKAIGAKAAAHVGASFEKPAEDVTKDVSKTASKAIGSAVGDAVSSTLSPRPPADRAPEDGRDPSYYSVTREMLDEFIEATRAQLRVKKHNATTTIRLLRSSAAQQARTGLVTLDEQLRAALGGSEVPTWFDAKVTMEWMNFCARMSLGGPKDAQRTELAGANEVGGILDSRDPEAIADWRGNHDGFVEIVLSVPDTIHGTNGVALTSAKAVTGPRAAKIVNTAGAVTGADDRTLTLATLPVFRRITLKTGSTALETNIAFVITPDGSIEADLGNKVLAAIGRGEPVELNGAQVFHGTERLSDDDRRDPSVLVERSNRAVLAMAGALRVKAWLATQNLSVVQ